MNRSLSVVLPVRNAGLTLADNLKHVFDVLADLTERFEVLLVDEGSTDHTVELAHELSIEYPQLRVSRRTGERVESTDIESGLDQTNGEVVFFHESEARFSPRVLRQLWESCHKEEADKGMLQRHYSQGGTHISARTHRNSTPRPLGICTERVTELDGVRMIQRAGQPTGQPALQ